MKKTLMLILCTAAALSVQAGTIRQDNLTLKAGRTSWSKQNGTYTTAAHGKKFIFIEVEISNKRSSNVYVNPLRFDLIDRDGNVYSGTISDRDGLDCVELRTGTKAKGRLAFEVPYNATAKELLFEISYNEEIRLRL